MFIVVVARSLRAFQKFFATRAPPLLSTGVTQRFGAILASFNQDVKPMITNGIQDGHVAWTCPVQRFT
jgi:hypothetical protein